MRENALWLTEDGALVVDGGLVTVERESGYGSVPGLDDEELADPAELERLVVTGRFKIARAGSGQNRPGQLGRSEEH